MLSRSGTSAMILRLHESDLSDLAEYTKAYLAENIENMAIEPFSHRVHHKLATGSLELENITILHFTPPSINYRPSEPGLLYIDTDGGRAELLAEWVLHSQFLHLLGLPLSGRVHGQIIGFASDIAVETPLNRLRMHQCVARFDRFELQLSGSIAAEILHWFNRALAKAIQSRVEQAYCRIIEERLLPWLLDQLAKLPRRLRMRFSSRIHFSQVLHSIRPGPGYIDLEMRNGGAEEPGSIGQKLLFLTTAIPASGPVSVPSRPLSAMGGATSWRRLMSTTPRTDPASSISTRRVSESVIDEEVVDEEDEVERNSEEGLGDDGGGESRETTDDKRASVVRTLRLHQQLRHQHQAIFHRPPRTTTVTM